MDPTINKIYQLVHQIESLTEELELADEIIDSLVEDVDVENLFEEKKKWIQDALKDKTKGALHKQMHVKGDKKIPLDKLKKASHKGGKLGKRAQLALTLRKLSKNKNLKESATNDFADSARDPHPNQATKTNAEEAITWTHSDKSGNLYPSKSYLEATIRARAANEAFLAAHERSRVYRDVAPEQLANLRSQLQAMETLVKQHPHYAEAQKGHPSERMAELTPDEAALHKLEMMYGTSFTLDPNTRKPVYGKRPSRGLGT